MRILTNIMKSFAAIVLAAPLVSCSALGGDSSALECGEHCDPPPDAGDGCTLTQGYWKNHEEAWPVDSLMLGSRTYAKAELLLILRTPVQGNGLISLSHQLIAAKLNVAAGADDAAISASIAAADALIGDLVVGVDHLPTSDVGDLVGALDGFNNGASGPGHCDDNGSDDDGDSDSDSDSDSDCDGGSDCDGEEPPPPTCGDGSIGDGEQCDDGNTAGGDGCSATCTTETSDCVCGDGVVHPDHEACDDGNTVNGDGCSATCQIEPPPAPVCGNGHVESGEACDDGNTTAGDGCSATCTVEQCGCPICSC